MKRIEKSILLVHGSADFYGSGKSLIAVVKVYQNAGWKVTILLPYTGPLEQALSETGADVIISELGVIRRKYLNPLGLLNRLFANIRAISTITRVCKEREIDIVHSNTLTVLSGGIAAKRIGIPHVMHIREIIKENNLQKKILTTYVKKYVDLSIAVSQEVSKSWSLSDSKSKVIYNGINLQQHIVSQRNKVRQELGLSEDTLLIGMVARVHYWKGQSYFLNIAKELTQTIDSDLHFILTGDVYPGYEYLKKELDASILAFGLGGKVTDLGYRSDVPDILASFDVFVLPSILPDPLPNTVLEAMASGKPVVATRHGGALEMVSDGETGLHIPWDNVSAAVEIIKPLLYDKEMRISFGELGKKRVEEMFSIESFEQRLISIINQI